MIECELNHETSVMIKTSKSPTKPNLALALVLFLCSFSPALYAQEQVVQHVVVEVVQLDQAELDQILAPIALYPDALLSQILVASTYPIEIVQADRWREENSRLSEDKVIAAVADKNWDPSVKALAPYGDLLARLSDDLDWLQRLGDAFLSNEDQVLASVQGLRQIAQENGSIADSEYFEVVEEDNNIIIESTQREIVYVPYYDTRVVYGDWHWYGYQPVYWDRPLGYTHLHGGFYWNSGFYVRPSLFFGGFLWGSRHLVIDNYYYDRPYRYNQYYPSVRTSYTRWSHDPIHRRGVRYPQKVVKSYSNVRGVSNVNSQRRSTSAIINPRRPGVNNVQEKLVNGSRNNPRQVTTQSRQTRSAPSVVKQTQTRTTVNRPSLPNPKVYNRTPSVKTPTRPSVNKSQVPSTNNQNPSVYKQQRTVTPSATSNTRSRAATSSSSPSRTRTQSVPRQSSSSNNKRYK